MKKLFRAEDFTPTRWDTAEDKAKFANHFVRFVESDFKETLFPKWFYTRLSMTFGYIVHYDRVRFYSTFFITTANKLRFLTMTARPWTNFAGDPKFTYCDVERALAEWVKESGLLEKYSTRWEDEIKKSELETLARLKAKYEHGEDLGQG